ncbi:hypothetical protein BT96DRAFT_1017667 [Gymnopus androsaceus JB14]|uniref:Uncharacterized protein n=1 Tax=Gymnopus androsaceus JB14 TaxID=1447944 RepID=A0A6A4HZ89_9AGAR|nr:hypothetical protein BT96DRAFT_1017667 [Gymnopus androsaceus JB14]
MPPLSPQDLCLSPESPSESTSDSDSKRRCRFRGLVSLTSKYFLKPLRKSALLSGPPLPPRFPIEIIQLIIHETWALPLTTSERIQFTKSSFLVSLSWMSIFARESCIHVHLLSGEHTKYWYKPITSGFPSVYSTIVDPRDAPQTPGATHPAHPMCVATNLISGVVRHGGFDNFEGCMTMQFPHTVNFNLIEDSEDHKWLSCTVLTTPQFWQIEIASCIAELYDVLEKLVLWMMQSRWERLRSLTHDRHHKCIWAWFFVRYNTDGGKVSGSMTGLNAADYNIGIDVGYVPLSE